MMEQLPASLPIFLWPHAAQWNWELIALGLTSLPWIIGTAFWIYCYKKAVKSGEYIVLRGSQRKLFQKKWGIAALFVLFAFLFTVQLYSIISLTVQFNKALMYSDRPVVWYKRIAFFSPIMKLTKKAFTMSQPVGDIPWTEIIDTKLIKKTVDQQEINELVIELSPLVQEEMKEQRARSIQKYKRRRKGSSTQSSESLIAEKGIQKESGNLIINDDYMITLPRLKELIDAYRKR
jgi:hypothetical protein